MILVLFTWRSPQKSTERKSRQREGVRLAWRRSSRSCGTKSCSPTLQGIAWYQWWCRWKCFSLTSAISTWGGHIDRPGTYSTDPSSNCLKWPLFEPNKRTHKQMFIAQKNLAQRNCIIVHKSNGCAHHLPGTSLQLSHPKYQLWAARNVTCLPFSFLFSGHQNKNHSAQTWGLGCFYLDYCQPGWFCGLQPTDHLLRPGSHQWAHSIALSLFRWLEQQILSKNE